MPTGPLHERVLSSEYDANGSLTSVTVEDCRCMIGEDHDGDGDTGESLSVDEAADIWLSNGMDEDYMFGYSDADLRSASGLA